MDLNWDQVNSRLTGCQSEASITETYNFGTSLLKECVERIHYLDSKATSLAGYSGAMIALLISTFSLWRRELNGWWLFLVIAGALVILIAAAVALWTNYPKPFDWFSDSDWLPEKYLNSPDQLNRFRIGSMYIVIKSHGEIASRKNTGLKISQWLLGLGALLMFIALASAACQKPKHLFLSSADLGAPAALYGERVVLVAAPAGAVE